MPGAARPLQRFALRLALVVAGILFVVNVTPLAGLWFGRVVALPPALIPLAQVGLWIGLLAPAFAVLESWFNGLLLHSRKTRGITEGVFIGLIVIMTVLTVGIVLGSVSGVHVVTAALVCGAVARLAWLRQRARPMMRGIEVSKPQFVG